MRQGLYAEEMRRLLQKTFAPIVTYDLLRVLLTIVATKDLELAQFDIQSAFLYGKLEEEIFMELPP